MILLKSKTLSNYYGNTPNEYELKFIHYNIDVAEESKEEYQNIEKDIIEINNYDPESLIIYFSDINNLSKILINTNIINRFKDRTYLRIRNLKEYENYKNIDNINNITLIIELKDLKNFEDINENFLIQIDRINELPMSKLKKLSEKFNIKGVLVGQIAYLSKKASDLFEQMSRMYKISPQNQIQLEKNNKITNDIYDVLTYENILNKMNNIVNSLIFDNKIEGFYKIYNYIANNVIYDTAVGNTTVINNQNLINPLFFKKGVCEGFSKLLQQMLSLIGIESIIVSSEQNKENGGHLWNQVYINKIWYNADVTTASYAIHNNKRINTCLVKDEEFSYITSSAFAHKCKKTYKNSSKI